ncbi:hypothetical protein H6G18_15745 [Anabaena subtropica FACHB-260]|uniref:Uncharacterized protein n=1 Tax=Anabaena subtropica FACHB-260 TaxID=2692884 RepID=A0ABR8CQX6_9NOST|nr:hypothetical protein [Anabaena subtropica FACHB-260]
MVFSTFPAGRLRVACFSGGVRGALRSKDRRYANDRAEVIAPEFGRKYPS